MQPLKTTEGRWNGLSIEDLSDLTGINSRTLAEKLPSPEGFTLAEVAELAPHLGMTVVEYVAAVLA